MIAWGAGGGKSAADFKGMRATERSDVPSYHDVESRNAQAPSSERRRSAASARRLAETDENAIGKAALHAM
jgi:hypothetical protein